MKNNSGKMLTKVSIYFVLLTSLYTTCEAENISIGLMGFLDGHNHVVFLSKIGAAVPVAIDKINKNSTIMENVTLSYTVMDTMCDRKNALSGFVNMVTKEGVDILLGPAWGVEIEVVGLLASKWNVPMVNYVSVTEALEDKKTYDTLIMAGGNHKQTGDVVRKVVAHLRVEYVCLYTPLPMGHHAFVREGIMKETRKENITVQSGFTYDLFSFNPSKHRDPLKDIKTQCRGKTVVLVTLEKKCLESFVILDVNCSRYLYLRFIARAVFVNSFDCSFLNYYLIFLTSCNL